MFATLGLSSPQIEILRSMAIQLSEVPGIAAVVLGGSYARGTARPDSDLDIGIYYSEQSRPDIEAIRKCVEIFSMPASIPTVTDFYE